MDLLIEAEIGVTEAGNYVLTASEFHGLAANFGVCACVLHVTGHSTLTRLAHGSLLHGSLLCVQEESNAVASA